MKKFICFLLSFIVLLTTFVVPSAAASENVDNLVIIRGFLNRDTNFLPYGDWYEVSKSVYFGTDFENIEGTGQYVIGNSVSSNPVGDYCTFIKIYNEDNSSISTTKQDLRFELNGLYDYFMMGTNPNEYSNFFWFDGSQSSKISVTVKDLSGNSHSIENFTINTKVNSDNTWKLSLDIPFQEFDIYHVYIRFYFNIYSITGKNIPPNVWQYGFNGNPSAVIDLEPADKTTGLLNTILEWLEGIWEGITGLPELIRDKLSSLFESISNGIENMKNAVTSTIEKIKNWLFDTVNGIIEGLKSLFIPSEGFIDNNFDLLRNKFNDKLGILTLPTVLLTDTLNAYFNIGNSDGIIYFPSFEMFGVTFLEGGNFNLKYLIEGAQGVIYDKVGFYIMDTYLIFVDVLILLMVVQLASKKYNNIIRH